MIIPVLDFLDSYFKAKAKAKGYPENTIFVLLDLTLFILLFLIFSVAPLFLKFKQFGI